MDTGVFRSEFAYKNRFPFLLSLLFSFALLLLIYSSMRLLVTGLRYSSQELVLRLLPPARVPCVATCGGGT